MLKFGKLDKSTMPMHTHCDYTITPISSLIVEVEIGKEISSESTESGFDKIEDAKWVVKNLYNAESVEVID